MAAIIQVSGNVQEIIAFARTLSLGVEAELEGVTPEIREALKDGRKIDAIRIRREQTGCGLKEAKDWVESLPAKYRPLPASP